MPWRETHDPSVTHGYEISAADRHIGETLSEERSDLAAFSKRPRQEREVTPEQLRKYPGVHLPQRKIDIHMSW